MLRQTPLLILMVLCPLGLVWAENWPQWQGPERTCISKEKGLLKSWPEGGPKLLWTFEGAGSGYSGMAVVGNRLYTMGGEDDKECVFAIDLKTQKKLWSVEVGELHHGWSDGPRGTPTIDGKRLYAVGSYGNLICVNTTTGKKVWSHEMKTDLEGSSKHYGYTESPLIDGDLVIATPGGEKGTIAAFNKKTGKMKWRSADCSYGTSYSSLIVAVIGGVRQYIQIPNAEVGADETVVGVRASDGKLLWEFPSPKMVSTPIYHDGCVYVSSMQGCKLHKIVPDGDKFTTEEVYSNEEMKNHIGSSVLVGDYLYGYSMGKGVMCQEFKTGKTVWAHEGGGSGSLIYAEGNLYCYHEKPSGEMVLVKATPKGYKEKGRFHIPDEAKLSTFTPPVVANGKLYLRDQDRIFCYDISKPK